MIGEKERYHGVALLRLLRGLSGGSPLNVEATEAYGGVVYLINDRAPMYVKYSTNRASPWAFSFTDEQRVNVEDLECIYGLVWLVFVCGNEGVLTAEWRWVRERVVRSDDFDAFSVTISRRRAHQFRISGSGTESGSLAVAESAFPREVIASARRETVKRLSTLPVAARKPRAAPRPGSQDFPTRGWES